MPGDIIDVWDIETFDTALLSELQDHGDLIRDYIQTDREISDEYEKSDHTRMRRSNPFVNDFVNYRDHRLLTFLESRTIRAWHYSRMTDAEVSRLCAVGILPNNLTTIRTRLDAMVIDGEFDQAFSDHLFERSPFHDDPYGGRTDKFWMTSHPVTIDDGGVESLLGLWGGESAAFTHNRSETREPLSRIGKGRILEVAVPLAVSRHAFSAAQGVLSGFAASIGLRYEHSAFDLYSMEALPPAAILAIHSEGEANFAGMAQEYPARFTITKPPPYRFG